MMHPTSESATKRSHVAEQFEHMLFSSLSLSLGVGEYNISVICNCDNIVILNKFYVLTAEKW